MNNISYMKDKRNSRADLFDMEYNKIMWLANILHNEGKSLDEMAYILGELKEDEFEKALQNQIAKRK